jgi:predicted RNase H-like nuclease (RuvC/YqgF family)
MTIQAWNIVLNAAIVVVLAACGLWLRNIVNQQLKSKDTAIAALEAVIKIKEAEISALKSDTAPAITKAYAEMREHANRMTAEVQHLSQQLMNAAVEQQRLQQALAEVKAKLEHYAMTQEWWQKRLKGEGTE